jgi:hypothetical protein
VVKHVKLPVTEAEEPKGRKKKSTKQIIDKSHQAALLEYDNLIYSDIQKSGRVETITNDILSVSIVFHTCLFFLYTYKSL